MDSEQNFTLEEQLHNALVARETHYQKGLSFAVKNNLTPREEISFQDNENAIRLLDKNIFEIRIKLIKNKRPVSFF